MDSDTDDRGDSPPATSDIERHGTFTIHGSGTLFGITTTGIESQPIDLSADPFASYSLSHGQLVRDVGAGEADGTFTVPVTAGDESWELETNLFGTPFVAVGDARHPDLNQHVLGRLDATFPSVETDVSVSATGLDAWDGADTVQITTGNNGGIVFFTEFLLSTPPAVGDTTISAQMNWVMPSFLPPVPLVEAAKGDVAVVSQLVAKTSGTESYVGLDRAGTAVGFTQTNGVASTLTTAMSAVPQTSLALHWRGAKFETLRAESGAGAVDFPAGDIVFIDALPDAAQLGFYTTSPDLMLYTPSNLPTNIDATVTYGNPFSNLGKPWDEYLVVFYQFAVPVQLGTAAPFQEIVGYQSNLALSEIHDGVLTPQISPARHVRISGKDLGSPQTGVGASPTVRWDAPRIGHATHYQIILQSLGTTSEGETSVTSVATFVTKDRSLRIPSNYLAPGGTFVLVIEALDFGDVDRTTHLFGDGLPVRVASSVTSTFTP